MPAAPSFDVHLALAGRLADAAGAVIRPHFRTAIAVDRKADESPVTVADREAEAVMRRLIGEAFPDHGILGEEYGAERPDAGFVWVLDPIDGTKSFISGVPMFGTLIALLHEGRPVLGVIDQPVLGERWTGAAGRATVLNDRPVRARACPATADATLFATSPDLFAGADRAAFDRLTAAVRLLRFGADCYAYGLLASGHIDLVAEAGLQIWDFSALVPVVEGAGGRITDWQGAALDRGSDGRVLATGDPALHEAALALLAGG